MKTIRILKIEVEIHRWRCGAIVRHRWGSIANRIRVLSDDRTGSLYAK